MYKGHVDISHIDDEMLYRLKFVEHVNTVWSAGYWDRKGVAVPDYPHDAPWVQQVFEGDCPGWVANCKDLFPWLKYSMVTVNKILPGRFIAPHTDTLFKMQQKVKNQNIDISNLTPIRINLFLQDRLEGHYFEMENEAWIDYVKGDFTIIKPNCTHLVANLGYQTRFTMQLTGYAKEENLDHDQ